MIIANVDRYHLREPLFEGVRVILSHYGEPYSPAYIQGLSGTAFRLGGICPCAPTCTSAMDQQQLAALLGYGAKRIPFAGETIEARQAVLAATMPRLDAELAAGRPFLLWHAFTMLEWDVVVGHEGGRFFGRGSYLGLEDYADEDDQRAASPDAEPALGVMLIHKRSAPTREALCQAEKDSVREAVRHAHDVENLEKVCSSDRWVFLQGLAAYDRWVSDFGLRAAEHVPPLLGDMYCGNVYAATHRAAAAYLQEIAPRHGACRGRLLAAAECFYREAAALADARDRINSAYQAGEASPGERERIVAALRNARDAYAAAIDELKAALPDL